MPITDTGCANRCTDRTSERPYCRALTVTECAENCWARRPRPSGDLTFPCDGCRCFYNGCRYTCFAYEEYAAELDRRTSEAGL